MRLLLYCRSGMESLACDELKALMKSHKVTVKHTELHTGFYCVDLQISKPIQFGVSDLVFTRQILWNAVPVYGLFDEDKATPLTDGIAEAFRENKTELLYRNLYVDFPDTEEGKKLSQFAKKILLPLENRLKRLGFKKVFAKHQPIPSVGIFFSDYENAHVGILFPERSSPHPQGIMRLKMPKEAPSRSTLKLEEALYTFLTDAEQTELLKEGMTAVDLGASPGGWTYQMLKRGMTVFAVDSGAMDESLQSLPGTLHHLRSDAFTFQPKTKVHWLLCDMIEAPERVSSLICQWLQKDWCDVALFNLKLPNQKSAQLVSKLLDKVRQVVGENGVIKAKQLYHDRDEITVFAKKV